MFSIVDWKGPLKKFHENEDGMQIIESVMVLAIASALAIGLYYLFQKASIGNEKGIFGLLGALVSKIFGKVGTFVTDALGF